MASECEYGALLQHGQGPLGSVCRACAPHAEGHGLESRRWLSLSGSFRVPAFLGIPCPHGSCQFAFYGQPGSRDELLALRAALCLRTFKQGAERATRRAGSKRIAWLGCARGAACLLDCLTALVLLCRFGTAVLLPRAKVPALGRRPDVVPDVVPQAAQPVLKTRHSLGPPMLDVPASRSGREGKRDLLVALAFQA